MDGVPPEILIGAHSSRAESRGKQNNIVTLAVGDVAQSRSLRRGDPGSMSPAPRTAFYDPTAGH